MDISTLTTIYAFAKDARRKALHLLDGADMGTHTKVLLCEYITYLSKVMELAVFVAENNVIAEEDSFEEDALVKLTRECAYIENELNLKNICFTLH